jgi:hypothetical protein
MRKIVALTLALFLSVGAVFADEIAAVFKKYEDGKLTVTVDEKDKTYAVDTAAKVKFKDKDGNEKEVALTDSFKRFKEGTKIKITVEGDKVTKVTGGKGGKDKKTDK